MLTLLTIFFPILSGIILYFRNLKQGSSPHRPYAICMAITDVLAVLAIFFAKPFVLFSVYPHVSFAFSLDTVGRWFMAAVVIAYTLALSYTFVYMRIEERDSTFFCFYFVSMGALLAVCMSANLVTAYFAFEITTLSTVPLVLHEQTQAAVAAGLKYLFYSIAGALMGLLGVFYCYQYAGESASFTAGGFLDAAKLAGHEPVLLVISFITIIGFGTKAGMYPMHGWLPTAHPIAPAPASALLSGIIAKSGVLMILRYVYFCVGTEHLRGTWVQYAWLSLTLLTIFMGSMMAFREKILKKRLAYSTVSQISYALLGLALMTQEGLEGSLLQVMQHAASKSCLFLCAGAFIYYYGIRRVDELRGIGLKMPIVLWCFTIAAMSLVGIPPLGGFTSKWHLAQAALGSGLGGFSIAAPVLLLISALLTAGYLFPIMINGFFPGEEHHAVDVEGHIEIDVDDDEHPLHEEASRMMWIPLIGFCIVSLLVGLFGNSLISLFGGIV